MCMRMRMIISRANAHNHCTRIARAPTPVCLLVYSTGYTVRENTETINSRLPGACQCNSNCAGNNFEISNRGAVSCACMKLRGPTDVTTTTPPRPAIYSMPQPF